MKHKNFFLFIQVGLPHPACLPDIFYYVETSSFVNLRVF